MDRITAYRGEIAYEGDLLGAQRYAYEALGMFALDVLGASTVVARLPCTPTSPASFNVKVGPGSIYKLSSLEATDWGKLAGTGGLDADTTADHQPLKQGLLRDTQTFAITPPGTSGQSQVYLIQAQFQEADDTAIPTQFYNTANPNAPITNDVSPARRDKCVLSLKAGTAATTGTQTCPAADAGWVPVWAVTVVNGAASINSGNIATAPSAPFVTVGAGGGAPAPTNWQMVTGAYTASPGDKLHVKPATSFTINLPAAPVAEATVVQVKGHFAAHTVTLNGNGHNFDFGTATAAATYDLNADLLQILALFDGTNWVVN